MECRYCGKPLRESKNMKKRLGLCTKCYAWDKKSFAEGFKNAGLWKVK